MNENVKPLSNPMTCEEFQDKLPEFLDTGGSVSDQEHLRSCDRCTALVEELRYIVDAAKLLWPLHDPSPAVWDNIQKAVHEEEPPPPAL